MRKGCLFLAIFLAMAGSGLSQRASNWRVYRTADDLPENACLSVVASPRGRVLITHRESRFITIHTGYDVVDPKVFSPEGSHGPVYESPGGQLWTVSPDGLLEYRDKQWVLHPVREVADAFRGAPLRSPLRLPLYPVRQDHVVFLVPGGVIEFNAEDSERPRTETLLDASESRIGRFTGMVPSREGGVWIAGENGLARLSAVLKVSGVEIRQYPMPELGVQNLRQPQEDKDGVVVCVGENSRDGQSVVVLFDGSEWKVHLVGSEKITHAWRGPDKALWALTSERLLRATDGLRFEEDDTLGAGRYTPGAGRYYDVAVERDGAFWLATVDGLFRYALPVWQSPAWSAGMNAPVHSLAEDGAGRLWFVSGGRLHVVENNAVRDFTFPEAVATNAAVAAEIFVLKDNSLLLEAGDRYFQFDPGTGEFRPLRWTAAAGYLNGLGPLREGAFCFQILRGDGSREYDLQTFDGREFQEAPFPSPGATLPGKFSAVLMAQGGDVWLAGGTNLAWFHDNRWQIVSAVHGESPTNAMMLIEIGGGKVWCAIDRTIWEFDGRDWITMRNGIDNVNALVATRDGSVWVATDTGLLRYHRQSWIEMGVEEGLPGANVRELFEDRSGRLWAGARGVTAYHPEADPDPPEARVEKTLGEKDILVGTTIPIRFHGQDRWKQTSRDRLLFSYRLDERDWTPYASGESMTFMDLDAGNHYFQVRAMDRNGNESMTAHPLTFTIVRPWYREARLVTIAFMGMVIALFFAGLAFNRHRRLLRSYAEVERKVAERTRELDQANRELFQSQKMNALGTLAAGIAHDFNNILSIIKGSAQIIEDNLDKPEKIRTRLDRIKTVVEQGSGVIQAMLGFSRTSDGAPVPCDLNDVVGDTIRLLGDRFLREVKVSFEPGKGLPQIAASRDFIQQILLNFIFNAAESMSDDKRVILGTRQFGALPRGMVLMPGPAAEYVAVTVRDFGTGIPPENLSRIFEPFFTTKAMSTRRGTGLGLSMVYELARKLEAGLAVESVVNQGSTFTLILPVRDVARDAKDERNGTESPAADSRAAAKSQTHLL